MTFDATPPPGSLARAPIGALRISAIATGQAVVQWKGKGGKRPVLRQSFGTAP